MQAPPPNPRLPPAELGSTPKPTSASRCIGPDDRLGFGATNWLQLEQKAPLIYHSVPESGAGSLPE